MNKRIRAVTGGLGLALLLAVAPQTQAADHYDGDATSSDWESDIADFYAFSSDDDGPKRLVLIMNTNPRAGVDGVFSDAVNYGFRIRPASLERTERGVANRVTDREFRVSCGIDVVDPATFSQTALSQIAKCTLFDGQNQIASTEVAVNDESGGSNPAFRVFAGLRADPFFTDAGRIRLPRPRSSSLGSAFDTGNAMRPAKTAIGVKFGGTKETQGMVPNVLGLVVEIDVAKFLEGTKFAIVAETTVRPEAGQ